MKMFWVAAASLALAGCSGMMGDTGSYGANQASAGAEFRYHARDAWGGLNPVCPFTDDADLLSRYEPLQARLDALEEWIGGTALAVDMQSVRADYDYYWSQNQVSCAEKDTAETAAKVDGELKRVAAALEAMERGAGVN